MAQAALDNRREIYRNEPPPTLEPALNVIHDGARFRADRVIDISHRGAKLEFNDPASLKVNAGQVVTVSIMAPGLDGCADVPARVVFNAVKHGRLVVALVFTAAPDVTEHADGVFFSLFNRRRDVRTEGGQNISAVVMAGNAPDDELTGFEINVLNHSNRGIGFTVTEALDRLLRNADALEIAIQTPDYNDPQQVSARVLHRVERGESIYYGCMFKN